ncbi:MAG: hypothetical protein GX971_02350 [Firmicutes bacterium]|nr:hypothetical protein [Bacillota bacterium]
MESRHLGALALIIFGGYFLGRNLGILPGPGVIWPLVLIGLGLVALSQTNAKPKKTITPDGEVIYEVNGISSLFKGIVGIPILFIVLVVGLIMLGIVGPLFMLSLLFIPFVLFFKLGWAFLRVLVAIIFGAAPLLLLLWILFLIF